MTRRRDLEELAKERLEHTHALLERVHALELELAVANERGDGWRTKFAEDTATIAALELERDELVAAAEAGWGAFVKRRIIVNTTEGEAFAGILWDGSGPIVLRDATLLGEHGEPLASPAKLDGEAIIDFARVAWVQIPAAAEL